MTPLALTSSLATVEEKSALARAIIHEAKTPNLLKGKIQMPPLSPGATLQSRIGPQSLHFFVALKIGTSWLEEPVDTWHEIPAFQKLAAFARSVPISNVACERMIKRTTDYANHGGKSDEDFQALLLSVGSSIEQIPKLTTKKALIKGLS